MAPWPAKPPSDDLLSSLASLAPTRDPHRVALPFLLARPNYPFYLTPTPTSTTSPSPARSNQRKVRRRDKGGFSELPLINVAARVPPRFQPLPNGSWVASDCWTLHGRQSCNPSVRHSHLIIHIFYLRTKDYPSPVLCPYALHLKALIKQ